MTALKESMMEVAVKYDTERQPLHSRREWLRDMIAREYTKVEVSSPANVKLRDQTTIYPWEKLKLSTISSNGIKIERMKVEPYADSQANYLAVLLLSGRYMVAQDGREAFLQPGEMVIFDATKPHLIHCPAAFSKVIVSVPKQMLRERLPGVELCTARTISGQSGVGLVTANLIASITDQVKQMETTVFNRLSEVALDSLTLALTTARPERYELSGSRSFALYQIKSFIERNLTDPALTPDVVAQAMKCTPRYINLLLQDENTSLMRYVLARRLKHCYDALTEKNNQHQRISDVAFKWGFNDISHFSRTFKQAFDATPTEILNAKQ